MKWNLKTPCEWELENLATHSGRTLDIFKGVELSSHEIEGDEVIDEKLINSSGVGGFSGSDLGHGSSSMRVCDSSAKEGIKIFATVDGLAKVFNEKEEFAGLDRNQNFSNLGANIDSGEPLIGLKLGKLTYFEDIRAASPTKTTLFSVLQTSSASTRKRSRVSYQSTQSAYCQVEGCNLDLTSAKGYHRRHRICESHSKSPKVTVAGMECRFCQQCSRIHDLLEFDDKKRSCRRRLSDHNARRRRPRPDTVQFNPANWSPQMNSLLNKVPVPVSDPTCESAVNFQFQQARHCLIWPAKDRGIDRKPHLPSDKMPNSIPMLHGDSDRFSCSQGTTPWVPYHGFKAAAISSYLDAALDLHRAHSLLSTNSWSLNKPEPTSLEQLMHGYHTTATQPVTHSESQSGAPASSKFVWMQQANSQSCMPSLDLHNIGSSQFQEF